MRQAPIEVMHILPRLWVLTIYHYKGYNFFWIIEEILNNIMNNLLCFAFHYYISKEQHI